VTTGPITAPIFLSYGVVKGAFIATEAAASLAVYLSKTAVFATSAALPLPVITQGSSPAPRSWSAPGSQALRAAPAPRPLPPPDGRLMLLSASPCSTPRLGQVLNYDISAVAAGSRTRGNVVIQT